MSMVFTEKQLLSIPEIISAPRFATYLQECNGSREEALRLYQWNLEISSAFVSPLHILEISLRNAVVESIEKTYSANWPWDPAFVLSLPNPSRGYSPRADLLQVRSNSRNGTVGKIVADLKFVFWQRMFTARHDVRIWNVHLKRVFPNITVLDVAVLRSSIYEDIEVIRRDLRNRIAHHEPIFTRNLQDDYQRILKLINYRDNVSADWINSIQDVLRLISDKP